MGPGTLEEALKNLVFPDHPDLLVGAQTRDDAGVYRLNDETALILTVDFFTPMVDDPFVFGQIAATNALNDVYAMGGKPLLAMNVVAFPECEDMAVLRSILAGGLNKVQEAGALLVGGHTVDDQEPKYGLSVTGLVHPDHIIRNKGARPGDVLLLTKPIGSGIIATAIKAGMASEEAYQEAVLWMSTLNKDAGEVMAQWGVNAATDVTGFGLLGHLHEMASASGVELEIRAEAVPLMREASSYAAMGLIPGGAYNNRDHLGNKVQYRQEIDQVLKDLLYCPETAGGLVMAVPEAKADQLQQALQERKVPAAAIGTVLPARDASSGTIWLRR